MARINLLPWREAARQQRRKDFLTAGGIALGVTLGLAVIVHLFIENLIANQEMRNQFLQGEIAKLNRQIQEIQELEKTKAALLARMEIIQQLQKSRPGIVREFDELVTALPDGVYLIKLDQAGQTVVVEGQAQSNARVSAFMSNIENSKSIGKPRLMLIENQDQTGTGLSHFRLSFDQIIPADKAASGDKPTSAPAS
jgi:type IV pilus assembly protein PilN